MNRSLALLFVLFSLTISGVAQQTDAVTSYCASVTKDLQHGEAFAKFCEWVVSFDTKLPNIIGDQSTRRFSTEKGNDRSLIDTTQARIAYVDSRPRFMDVEINHVKVAQDADLPEFMQLHGAWATDEFGGALSLLFGPHTYTHFTFGGETMWRSKRALVFLFDVPAGQNHRWQMAARQNVGKPLERTFPGYAGRVLLDPESFDLVRFERHTTQVEKQFPLRYGSNQVDYERLPLGDGTNFVLPTQSEVMFCHDEKHKRCEINATHFENWQKFGAKTRILTGAEPE